MTAELQLMVGKASKQMPPLIAFAFFALGASALDERGSSSFDLSAMKPPRQVERFAPHAGIRLPVADYTGATGRIEHKSGIIAGVSVAPNTIVGVGFFNIRREKSALAPDPQLDRTRRNSKKAAIGLSLTF